MPRTIVYIVLIFIIACVSNDPFKWVHALPDPWNLSERQLNLYLPQFHNKFPDYKNRLIALNLWRVGTPYGIFCLGEGKGIDPDPIIRIDTSDCTVHILTTMALAESQTFKKAQEEMIDLHYKPDNEGRKKPTYKSRWHYTSNRLLNNPRTPDITSKLAPSDLMESVQIEINRKQNGAEFLDLDWTSNQLVSFIPISKIDEDILEKLPKICGVAFVKKSYFKNGIVIAHEGFIINKKNLIHASSKENRTVNVDFLSYLFGNNSSRFDGVMFYDIIER